jgi:hypothetical protein
VHSIGLGYLWLSDGWLLVGVGLSLGRMGVERGDLWY